ncbi:MAG: transposase [candidate division KSB1 bacterium]|nr:transposase [candidate division KSB1 bacterium]
MRSNYKIYEKKGVYFVTSTITAWIPIFVNKSYFDILVSALNFCAEQKNLNIFAWVILDNHFHLVCQAPELSQTFQSLKRHTAKQIITQLKSDNKKWALNLFAYYKKRHKKGSEYQVWQEGFHPQLINSEDMLTQKIEYIHYNPVKRGYVEKPEHWLHSSARYFKTGDESPVSMKSLEFIL